MKKLGFGLMRLPLTDANDPKSVDINQLNEMVDLFLSKGFTYFDTAWMYHGGTSENAVKAALVRRHSRDSFTVADKLHGGYLKCSEDKERIFNEQLQKTGVEYFDFYLLHALGTDLYEVYKKYDCFNWLREKKRQGLAHKIGFSFHDSAELLDKVLTQEKGMDFVQLQLNYLDWNSDGVQSRKCYEVAVKHGLQVIVMEPVKGGTLANLPENAEKMLKDYNPAASVASWALRFAATPKNVITVLSGMSNLQQLKENIETFDNFRPVNREEKNIIEKVVDIINSSNTIACTGCSYCTDGCPMNIPIPKYFSLYNADLQENKDKIWKPQSAYYDNLTVNFGKASDCIGCRQCEQVCPQHLEITGYLKKVAERFED